MKRIMVLCLVMALLATMTIGVSATTITPGEYTATADKFTVEINVGTVNAGKMFGFVAVPAGEAIAEANIVYIDQATADSNGIIKFENFAPKGAAPSDTANWKNCDLYIGGGDVTDENGGAVTAGILKAATTAPVKYAITGTVLDDDITDNLATVTVYAADGDDEDSEPDVIGTATATVVGDFNFSIDVIPGTYSVKFVKDSYLKLTYTGVSVVDQAVSLNGTSTGIDMKALAGDITNNDVINMADLKPVLDNYNKSNTDITDSTADITKNNTVNMADLKPILDAYNDVSVEQPFAQ